MLSKLINSISFLIKSQISLPLQYPEVFALPNKSTFGDKEHLTKAVDWIKHALGSSTDDGVPAFYSLLQHKWGPSYRETTGYIIPTLIEYSKLTNRQEFVEIAMRMGNWEIKNQSDDGAIGEPRKDGALNLKTFNTGQVMLGFCALYSHTQNTQYIEAAQKAGDWLISHQSTSGAWDQYSNFGGNTIDTRVAWAMLALWKQSGIDKYKISAENFLTWALLQQTSNGWFDNGSLRDKTRPWTHAIAYSISGLLESSLLLNDQKLFDAAYKASEGLLSYYERTSYLPGSFDHNWESEDTYSCLTGNAQIAIEWQRIYQKTGEERFLQGAHRVAEDLKKYQIITGNNLSTLGGIGGSHPISGDYASFILPNWTAKFFADMLMYKMGHSGYLIG